VEIGAAVVWRVHDTAQAVFEIDDYTKFVSIQAEAAIRHLARSMPTTAARISKATRPRCGPDSTWWRMP